MAANPNDRRFSFAADLQSRDGQLTKDARIHNAFVEVDGDMVRLWQRPALGSGIAAPSGAVTGDGQGLVAEGDTLYSVVRGTLQGASFNQSYSLSSGTATGIVASYKGAFYAIDFTGGKAYRASPRGTLGWQLISTTVPIADGALGAIPVIEGLGYIWAGMGTLVATPRVHRSTDGFTWPVVNGNYSLQGRLCAIGTVVVDYSLLTNGATPSFFGTGTTVGTGTVSLAGTTAIDPALFGTMNNAAWVLGTNVHATGTMLLAQSTDGFAWTVVGTGTDAFPTLAANRMAAFKGILYAPQGTGTSAPIVAMKPGFSWGTAANVLMGSPVVNSAIRGVLAGPTAPYFLSGGVSASISPSGTLGTAANIVAANFSITPLGLLRRSNYVVMQGTSGALVYNVIAGTSGSITGTNFPGMMVPGMVYLDETYYVMEPDGTIWNSTAAADDPTTWPTDGFITAQFEPDDGVALTKALNYVVAMGQWTVELFWDAGNATGSPLSPVNNGVLLIGCASAGSIAQTESTIVWVAQRKGGGSTSQKGRFVAMLVGTEYKELSTPSVSRILDRDDLATVYAAVMELGGHTWYILALGTSGVTLVYDFETKKWYTWSRLAAGSAQNVANIVQKNGLATGTMTAAHGFADGDPIAIAGASLAGFNGTFNVNVTSTGTAQFTFPVSTSGTSTGTGATATPWTESYFDAVAVAGLGNTQLVQDSSGNVYTLSLDSFVDLGSIPLNVKLRTNNMNQGNDRRKFVHAIAVVGDILASQGYGLLRTTDDDFQTYSQYRRFDLSDQPVHENRWGNYRRRAYEWRYTHNAQFRLQYLEPDITQGVS